MTPDIKARVVEALRRAARMADTYAGILAVNEYHEGAVQKTKQAREEYKALAAEVEASE